MSKSCQGIIQYTRKGSIQTYTRTFLELTRACRDGTVIIKISKLYIKTLHLEVNPILGHWRQNLKCIRGIEVLFNKT